MPRLSPKGATVADVPSNHNRSTISPGDKINCELHLIVPKQDGGSIDPILAKDASDRGVIIIDPEGTIYNPK